MVVVEVRQDTLTWIAVEQEEEEKEDEKEEDEDEEEATDIKSNNPHLAGGEKNINMVSFRQGRIMLVDIPILYN